MKLSILITSIPERLTNLHRLFIDTEVIALVDRGMTIGEKRNRLVEMATGDYISFVDDDDFITSNYLTEIQSVKGSPDVICFNVMIYHCGRWKPVYYSINYQDRNYADRFERMPNHIMAIRRDKMVKFPHKNLGEDVGFARKLDLKTEHQINKFLYFYKPGRSWKK